MNIKYLVPIFQILAIADPANILAIIPTPSYSHQVAFYDFWNELSLRGHRVTLITTNPQKNETLTNLTDIDLSWSYKFLANVSKAAENIVTPWNMPFWTHKLGSRIAEGQLSHPRVQDLINDGEKHFDLVVIEAIFPVYLGFVEKYRSPTILISSMDVSVNLHYRIGNSAHPVLYPNVGSPLQTPSSFWERIESIFFSLYTAYYLDYVIWPETGALMRKFFNTTSGIKELIGNIDMLFLNVNPVVHTTRAVGATTINTYGLRKVSAQPLTQDLKEFLDASTHGFVYFSLGTNVKSKDLQVESLKAIVDTFKELPYRVLWKFEGELKTLPLKSDNVKLIKWAPQTSVLAHPKIKAFVTQGGLQSMEETIHFEVPCVVIPFFGDQLQNAQMMKNKGIAIILDRYPFIRKNELTDAIIEVASSQKYKKAVSEIKRLSSDTPMTGLEKAVWWTEYVLRHKGAKHLRSPAADLPHYQHYLLDVLSFLFLVAFISFSIIVILIRRIWKFLVSYFTDENASSNKKIQ